MKAFSGGLIVDLRKGKPLMQLSDEVLKVFNSYADSFKLPCKCEECLKKEPKDRAIVHVIFINAAKYTSLPHEPEKKNVYIFSDSDYWTRKYPLNEPGTKAPDELLADLYDYLT